METVHGSLNGRQGSFVLQHGSMMACGVARLDFHLSRHDSHPASPR
ncbi:DUF3224 domain-containing protein [Acidovorax sp. SUPP3334]|nr:DUF3224 domain-containing protein [Acidovorax sp. SUPP3334]GKT22708.1 hypothetical protein AVHM3334_09290 [Acidovorax sp. SUPP3334]